MKFKFLIIGQGIAGSLLARALRVRGCQVMIVDNHHHWSSSMISAGLINPVTGKRLVLTPQFDTFFQRATHCYQQLAQEFHQNFFIEKPIIRIFQSIDEREQFLLKKDVVHVIKDIKQASSWGAHIEDPFGSVVFSSGGICQGSPLLKALREDFNRQGVLHEGVFRTEELIHVGNRVQWKDQMFDGVIFCEGFQAIGNSWFNGLPFNNVKGEIVHIKMQANLPDAIFAQTKWCAPLGNSQWMAGATYDRESFDCRISTQGQHDILEGLKQFIKGSMEVTNHVAAIRPVILDQMPVLGLHPVQESLGIFNGLGSKGFLMAPLYADMFADYLMQGIMLPREVDVRRFKQI